MATPAPTATPTPTAEPTAAPTPTPEPAGSWPPAASCRNDATGLTQLWSLLRSGTAEVEGRQARVYELDATGDGFYAKGVREYVFVVDRGGKGALPIETVGQPGPDYEANRAIVDLMAGAIKID